jgi:predicted ArsR family transcriptional regulator
MDDEFVTAVTSVGALAEPARRRLYLYAATQPDAVSREQAAAACGIALHSAKFHLDRLVEQGLLEVEFRRLSGRSGPGAGRPSKLYRRADRELSVSVPERDYELAGDLLAEAFETAADGPRPAPQALAEVARARGRALAEAVEAAELSVGDDLERTSRVLARHGYLPHVQDRAVCLTNCPFDRLARRHTELVCGMNLALVRGILEGLGCASLEAVLDPGPDRCCVRARPVTAPE